MATRARAATVWAVAGFLLGAAVLAGGQDDEELDEKLADLEALSARVRAQERAEWPELPPVSAEGLEIDRIHLTDLLAGTPDWIKPSRDAGEENDAPLFGAMAEERPQAYGVSEELLELVRCSVMPEAWEEGATMNVDGTSLLLTARPDVLRAVRTFIDEELRPPVQRTVNLEVEVVEVPADVAQSLAVAMGGELAPSSRTALDAALKGGAARYIFAGRLLELSGQKALLWHGAQVAAVADAEVEVAESSEATDPVVRVELTGAIVSARSTLGGDPARVRVELDLEYDLLDPATRALATEKSRTLQMPARASMQVKADLWVASGRWAVAAERSNGAERRHFVLVRPTALAPEGGAR